MSQSNIIMYTTEDGLTKIEATFDEDTVWLSIDQMAELFQRDKSTISRHIKNIFTEGELRPEATVAKFATVQMEGGRKVSRNIEYYNLDVIISVGYRVKSLRGTQFRIWASGILKEYMKKGFALPALITTQRRSLQSYSLSRYRIKCTGQRISTRRQKLCMNERMPIRKIWG